MMSTSQINDLPNMVVPLVSVSQLVNIKDENEDFFMLFLSIKIKQRLRSLKMLGNKLGSIDFKAVQGFLMPLINYLLFGSKSQKKSHRNTLSYKSDEKRQLLEESLNVY